MSSGGIYQPRWEAIKLRQYVAVRTGFAFPSDSFTESGIPVIRISDIASDGSVMFDSVKYMPPETVASHRNYLVRGGEIVMAMTGAPGKAGRLPPQEIALLNQRVCVMSSRSAKLDQEFLWYLIQSHPYQSYIRATAVGSAQANISDSQLTDYRVAVPASADEQVSIAHFLDRETAKIDALIVKQEQLIATLREDRTATITHAVTKGLDPTVEMKESGVDWIGRVPTHWTVPQIGMNARIGNGSTPARDEPRYWSGGTVPWLNSSHVNSEEITETDQYVTDSAYRECHLPMVTPGSVLVGLTGQGKTRGMASVLLTKATINQHLAYITPTSAQLDSLYLHRVLASAYGLLRELSDENGSTKGGLTCGTLRKIRIPLPPVAEQQAIAQSLRQTCGRIDALINKANAVTATLREFRSALITDAVTGKIDVRGAA